MQAKICLVTGATSGVGQATARELARQGATVVLVGRNLQRCTATIESIRAETGNSAVEALVADLSSQHDIRRLAKEFLDRYPRLDVLINNAGAMFHERRETMDGIEMTFALNHLAYFLLTCLLLDRLKSSAPSRIINVASAAHQRVTLNWDDFQNQRRYSGFGVYSQSKLANILFTQELARRLQGTGVTANSVHPGLVASNFGSGNGWRSPFIHILFRLFGISPEKGAETVVYLATSPEVEGVSGKYFFKKKVVASSPASNDAAAAQRLWQLSADLTHAPACR